MALLFENDFLITHVRMTQQQDDEVSVNAKAPTCGSCQHYIVTSHGGGPAECLRGVVRLRCGVALDTPACDEWDLWQEPEHAASHIPAKRVRLVVRMPRCFADVSLPIDEIVALPGVRVVSHKGKTAIIEAPEMTNDALSRLAGGALIVEPEILHRL